MEEITISNYLYEIDLSAFLRFTLNEKRKMSNGYCALTVD